MYFRHRIQNSFAIHLARRLCHRPEIAPAYDIRKTFHEAEGAALLVHLSGQPGINNSH